ncbi:expressed unknown protein [Seminavis robusta]|uniref:Uncharacterized protein n=1 Tax=Seminavis robusta TaxID=568900 RepID=A0A9N8EE43_9STRA|nr:expressed unknown protein [Seminavis robusta]|eukprot:Sro990_g228621.1  (126) ;mRNA; f:32672-33111
MVSSESSLQFSNQRAGRILNDHESESTPAYQQLALLDCNASRARQTVKKAGDFSRPASTHASQRNTSTVGGKQTTRPQTPLWNSKITISSSSRIDWLLIKASCRWLSRGCEKQMKTSCSVTVAKY